MRAKLFHEMTDLERLLDSALRQIRFSDGWSDTAIQIAAILTERLPAEADRLVEYDRLRNIAHTATMERDSIKLAFMAHQVRCGARRAGDTTTPV